MSELRTIRFRSIWETWVRRDVERIVDKLKFARECNLELMADQIIDIADDAKEEDAVVAAMRIKVRQCALMQVGRRRSRCRARASLEAP
jgi:hypothetical protein